MDTCSVRGGIVGCGFFVYFTLMDVPSCGHSIYDPPVSVSLSRGSRCHRGVREAETLAVASGKEAVSGERRQSGDLKPATHLHLTLSRSVLEARSPSQWFALPSAAETLFSLACNECRWLFQNRGSRGGSPPTVSAIRNI